MRALLPLVLILLAPLTEAEPYECGDAAGAAGACAGERDEGECAPRGDGASAWAPGVAASVEAAHGCHEDDEVRATERGVFVSADAPPATLDAGWFEHESRDGHQRESGCATFVSLVTPARRVAEDAGCPLGPPPERDWGRLLP